MAENQNKIAWETILKVCQRPTLPFSTLAAHGDIIFQLLEIDYVTGLTHRDGLSCAKSLIRLYGTTETGHSVIVRVHNFYPYFYCEAVSSDDKVLPENINMYNSSQAALSELDKRAHDRELEQDIITKDDDGGGGGGGGGRDNGKRPKKKKRIEDDERESWILRIEETEKCPFRENKYKKMFKIYARLPKFVPKLRHCVEQVYGLKTFAADLSFVLRFMIDKRMSGCDWVRVDISSPSTCKVMVQSQDHITQEAISRIKGSSSLSYNSFMYVDNPESSRCDIEIDVDEKDVQSLGHEGQWSKHAPLRLLSFDIECAPVSKGGGFPEAKDGDPVITIGCRISDSSKPGRKNDIAVMLQLHPCHPIPVEGVITHWVKNPQDLLLHFRDLIIQSDPDVLTGYNTCNFDFAYLNDAAKFLNITREFSDFTRVKHDLFQVKVGGSTTTSRAFGTRDADKIKIAGRVSYDILQVVRQEYSKEFSSFTLNYVAMKITGKQKIDLDHKFMLPYFQGTDEERTKIATYCDTDTSLPLDMNEIKFMLKSAIEMSRCTGVTLGMIYTRGQQIKVQVQVAKKAEQLNCIIETDDKISKFDEQNDNDDGGGGGTYQGATVIDPVVGYHDKVVVVLDFASLYPSIMQAHNTCFRTYITPQQASLLNPGQYETAPGVEHSFIKSPRTFKEDAAQKAGLKKGIEYSLDPSGNAYFLPNVVIEKRIADSLGLKLLEDYDINTSTNDDKITANNSSATATATATAAVMVTISSVKKFGILPTVLAELVAARRKAKNDLKNEKDEEKRSIYDKRQLNLKICANSVYGTTGARFGKLSLPAIAESVTAWGREAIDFTKNTVEKHFSIANGFSRDAKVLYGDTDSVMVDFGIRAYCGKELLSIVRPVIVKYFNINEKEMMTVNKILDDISNKYFESYYVRATDDITSTDTEIRMESLQQVKLIVDNLFSSLSPPPPSSSSIDVPSSSSTTSLTTSSDAIAHRKEEIEDAIQKAVDLAQNNKGAELGKAACKLVTTLINRPPMGIEWEKNYLPWLISSKKRYAGHKYAANLNTGVIEDLGVSVTGLENKRRDNCALTRESMETLQYDVLILRNRILAVQHIRDTIDGIRTQRFPMDKFVITKGLSKKLKSYVKPPAQQALLKRIGERRKTMGADYTGTSVEFHLGDRIPYVICAAGSKELVRDKAEDPVYAAINNIPLDTTYYIERMIVKPLTRFCEMFVENASTVHLLFDPTIPAELALQGKRIQFDKSIVANSTTSSMIRINKSSMSTSAGSIDHFLVRTGIPCLNCNRIIPCNKTDPVTRKPTAPALCTSSSSDIEDSGGACDKKPGLSTRLENEIITELQNHKKIAQEICRKCEGNVGNSVDACGNSECPNIYIRIKATLEMNTAEEKLRRFHL